MEESSKQGRIESVDIAKGIAIICIVLGHLGFVGPDGADTISRAVFQFHVPVFFIIAGYFISTKSSVKDFTLSKLKRLLVPYIVTCFAMFLVIVAWKLFYGSLKPVPFSSLKNFLIAALYGAGSNGAKLPSEVTLIGAIWFLEALFIALVEVRLCQKLGKWACIPVIVMFVLAVFSSTYIWLPLNIQSGLIGGLYVYFGHLLRVKGIPKAVPSNPLLVALIIVAVVAFYANINVSLVRAYLGPYWLGIPVSLASSCLVIMVSDHIARLDNWAKRFLSFFGKNSLVVLCVHLVLLNGGLRFILVKMGVPTDYNILFFVLLTIHLVLAGAAALCVRRSKWLSKIF